MSIMIQRCGDCGAANYPIRDVCRVCLSDALYESEERAVGRLLAVAVLHRSLDAASASILPRRIGTVLLDNGTHILSFVADNLDVGARVRLETGENLNGERVFEALAE